ncbi:hypothetical protein H5410_000447 [Solanum commersonii]|uniref:Uncharacterized protein n=1 Tax=Solanum commersonii TaxID=4109 RepID=A0A9J6AWT2_SOLCO|nr:hypothetical protein H5410_000447 [Solanum commersonii]
MSCVVRLEFLTLDGLEVLAKWFKIHLKASFKVVMRLSWLQWFGIETSILEVSCSKPLASESKGFDFWIELVASGLSSAGYLSCVVCELLHRSGGFSAP